MAPTKPPVAKATPPAGQATKTAPKPKPATAPATVKKAPAAKPASPPLADAATLVAAKPRAAKSPPAKPAAARPAAPRARPVISPGSGKVIKLKDLLDQVVKATGAKKKAVKETVNATLLALGAALSRGDGLNLPALGKAQVNRQRSLAEGEMIIVKLRRHDAKDPATKGGAKPLAKADEEG